MLQQSLLPGHINVDLGGGRIIVSQHVLDGLDGYSLFHHQRPAGVPERVCRDLRIINADGPQACLDDFRDSFLLDALRLPATHQGDDQR